MLHASVANARPIQNSKSLRRLAADHGSLHTVGLPPNYLFPPSSDLSADLTSLDVLLSGPVGTPYASGVWRLHLDIPPTYPTAPPTASFRTRLWHPNIDENTGAVCVETLKRDWSSTLKLRDVLVTISCLLIQPNPASALNEAAGKLASEDWDGFCRRAKLMTEIHAAVPSSLAAEVEEAQMRGEDKEAEPARKETKPDTRSKGKERVKVTPVVISKVQRSSNEDVENTRRRGATTEPASDPESDWIPGPTRVLEAAVSKREDPMSGIRGIDETMQLDTFPKPTVSAKSLSTNLERTESTNLTDPFIAVTSKRPISTQASFDLRTSANSSSSSSSTSSTSSQNQSNPTSTDTSELLKLSHQHPFSALQLNNQSHPLLREFSYSWEDSELLHDTGLIKSEEGRVGVRKRMAGDEFEEKKAWELKRFKKAGFDLRKYNRGDFGPKTGIGRL
jgi:ubiquitin-conjugating enzyme E2 S